MHSHVSPTMASNKCEFRPKSRSTVMITVLITIGQLFTTNAEIRCYCNLPLCVSTGYMCKSSENVCFSELAANTNDPLFSRHGCLELLPKSRKELCRTRTRTKNFHNKFPLLLCCQEDMCNYSKSLSFTILNDAKDNDTIYISRNEDSRYVNGGYVDNTANVHHDLWFRAAVIAVPIAGCFILVMLVLLAVRVLKKDSKREAIASRQLKERTLLYNHLNGKNSAFHQPCHLVESGNKNTANVQLNQKHSNLYKNVNLDFTRKNLHDDKENIYDKSFYTDDIFCGSFLNCKKLNWKPLTPV